MATTKPVDGSKNPSLDNPTPTVDPAPVSPATAPTFVQVLRGFRGDTGEGYSTGGQFIAPGVYREDDPALFGMAMWLVEFQYATVL